MTFRAVLEKSDFTVWGLRGFFLILVFLGSPLSFATAGGSFDLCKANLEVLYRESHGERDPQRVGLAVAVAITRGRNEILLEKRRVGSWAMPGGKFEAADGDVETCIQREIREELGVELSKIVGLRTHYAYVDDVRMMYFTAVVRARIKGNGEPRIMESNKAKEIRWFRWSDIPSPAEFYKPTYELIFKDGFNPFKG